MPLSEASLTAAIHLSTVATESFTLAASTFRHPFLLSSWLLVMVEGGGCARGRGDDFSAISVDGFLVRRQFE